MSALRRPRGFTLVELLVGVAVGAIVVGAAVALLSAQQRSFRSSSDDRALQETARVALSRLSADLRVAGFGVDPALAFDFGAQAAVRMNRGLPGSTFASASLACDTPVSCRDSITGSDEVVFLSRDPLFGHVLRAAALTTSNTLSISGPLNVPLLAGQILQVMCYSGAQTWAYVQVSADVAASTDKTVSVPIEASTTSDFPRQNGNFADSCFSTVAKDEDAPATPPPGWQAGMTPDSIAAAAKVFKVDRYRYFVRRFTGRPYLMLDRGLGGAADVIAPDVEDLQLAYLLPAAAADRVVGAAEGTAIAADETGFELQPAAGVPAYGDDLADLTLQTHHPGNIRGVRVALVVRSPEPLQTRIDTDRVPAAGNRPEVAGDPGYLRLRVETTVSTPNMDARAPYFPMYGALAEQQNVGGG